MLGGKFTCWFLGVFVVVLVVLLFIFMGVSFNGVDGGASSVVWAALIVVFLLVCVIVISLFFNYLKDKL
ncbi:MAG: hypothetical protein KJ718_05905 [Nanoarchaeota archaeon]|nr:hypothetical protein [Nanoarchaeota archaeon]MBU1052056.1 hypothetical protein [Nanoarchaeota archaeon]MBU1988856.1 hypothetical protein [Nanoarchaeota archaeon]